MLQSDLIDWIETTSKITCSKCGISDVVSNADDFAAEQFASKGWVLKENDGGEDCLCPKCAK